MENAGAESTTPSVLQVGFCCKVVVMRTGMHETELSKPSSVVGAGFWGAARERVVLRRGVYA